MQQIQNEVQCLKSEKRSRMRERTELYATTAAGTFDCHKVTYDFDVKFGFVKAKGSGVEWYDKDKVLVKSESYNKKGKLTGYTELTKIN